MANKSIENYRKMLPVMKHRLDDELEIQAQMMDDISQMVVVCNSRMLQAKEDLARIEARLSDDFRESDPKLTKDQVESKVRRHRERITAWEKYQAARSDHEEWSAMLEAWRHKGYSIKTLADLYAADYFAVTSSSSATATSRRSAERDRHEPTDSGLRAAMRRSYNSQSHSTITDEQSSGSGERKARRGLLSED